MISYLLFTANQDPMSKMLGERFATVSGTDSSAYRFIEEIMRSPPQKSDTSEEGQVADNEHADEVTEKKVVLKLLLLLKDFDEKLLHEAVKQISS